MNLRLDTSLADGYVSQTQRTRVISEGWFSSEGYCPSCGLHVEEYENNRPVADFYCPKCYEDFELKSKKKKFSSKLVDGAYSKMIERLRSDSNPNFFLMNYDPEEMLVVNLFLIPKHFLTPNLIEKRKPLPERARRAGWIGCNLLLNEIPESGRIYYVKNGKEEDKKNVFRNWRKTLFLRESKGELRGWTLDVMSCLEKLGKKEITLQEVYSFEKELLRKHPHNRNIKAKIRQQLQFLRDKGYLEFADKGEYILK